MPMQIQSTYLAEDGMSALVEIEISDSTDPESSEESLMIRVRVEFDREPYLHAIQREALRRVRAICDEVEADLRAKWTKHS